jgi:hypothetical protein
MTDAEEPEVITQLLHSEECGRSVLYDVYGNAICIIAAILNHIDALTRERDEAVKRRREIDDEAFDYAEQIETLRTQLAAARVCKWQEDDPDFGTWRTGCGHLWQFNTGGPKENGTKFCQYCGGALDADRTVTLNGGRRYGKADAARSAALTQGDA